MDTDTIRGLREIYATEALSITSTSWLCLEACGCDAMDLLANPELFGRGDNDDEEVAEGNQLV
jgi:hypothetical protein